MENIDLEMKEYEVLRQEILEHQKRREQLFIITTTALGVVWGFLFQLVIEGNGFSFGITSFAPYIIIVIFCLGVLINSGHIICIGTYIRHFIENKHKEFLHWETAWDNFAQTKGDERKSRGYWYTLYFLAAVGTCISAVLVAFFYTFSDPPKLQKPYAVVVLTLFAISHVFVCSYCIVKFVQRIHWGKMNWEAREKWNERWREYKNSKKAITNEKVAGLAPQWASFHGFSLLFDNPGNNLLSLNDSNDFLKIHCNCSQSDLELYASLSATLTKIEQELSNDYLFCQLPNPSYHVTVLDGLNNGNVEQLSETERAAGKNLLECLPSSFNTSSLLDKIMKDLPFSMAINSPITFKFDKLAVWHKSVLVACLVPADDNSEDNFNHLKDKRRQLLEKFRKRFGVKTATSDYIPHVSLGYFANKEFAKLESFKLDDWTKKFKVDSSRRTITFSSVGIYGFTDMVTFFKPK